MFSWIYTGQLSFAALFLGLSIGCVTVQTTGGPKARSGAAKDCPTCHRMCELAGSTEKNPDAVTDCKADCDKTCR